MTKLDELDYFYLFYSCVLFVLNIQMSKMKHEIVKSFRKHLYVVRQANEYSLSDL